MQMKWRVIAAAIAGLIASLLLYQREKELENRAFGGQRIPVLIAKNALNPGQRVQESDLGQMEVPEVYLHPQSIKSAESSQILGRPLANEVKQGQPIQWTDFGASERGKTGGAVPKGLRGTAILVNELIGKSGLVGPGERVDVLGTFGSGNEIKGSMTVTLLQNVPLIEITGSTAMLALELEDAELLTFAAAHGTVSLLLRNAEDLDVKKDIPPKSFNSLLQRVKELEQISTSSSGVPSAGSVLRGIEQIGTAAGAKKPLVRPR